MISWRKIGNLLAQIPDRANIPERVRFAAVLIALSQPVGFVSELAGGPKWLAVAAQVAFAIGLVPVGIRVLRQSDDAWESRSVVGEASSAAV